MLGAWRTMAREHFSGAVPSGSSFFILLFLCCLPITSTHGAGSLDERVANLLSKMTLAEKIGQMSLVEIGFLKPNATRDYLIGGLLNGGNTGFPNGKSPQAAWAALIDGYQREALSTRLGIPMIYGTDAVHGHGGVIGATVYPHNIGLGATRNSDLSKRIASMVAVDVRGAGAHWNFAPCVAVCRDPRWGRCYESFGETPELVEEMSSAIEGYQGWAKGSATLDLPYKCAATAKHFAGDGGTTGGIDRGNVELPYAEFLKIHLDPYRIAVKQDVATVMVSFSSYNGIKMHVYKELVTGYLKNKLNFKGFVVSDWGAVDLIDELKPYSEKLKLSVNAGIDMFMIPDKYEEFQSNLTALVKARNVSMSRINDAVRRILRVKIRLGLFERPYSDPKLTAQFSSKASKELARSAVRQSLVLLKNSKGMLPLSKKAKSVLVVGEHANNVALQCGGWTLGWQGANLPVAGTPIIEAVRKSVSSKTTVTYSASYSRSMGKHKYAIVVVGEPSYAEFFGDNTNNLTLASSQITLIQDVCSQMPCVVVVISGRPVYITEILPKVNALVAAWLPGTEGRGVTDVLFGDYPFKGKLPITWFKDVSQLPIHVGDKNYKPLFPFGYGLSYPK